MLKIALISKWFIHAERFADCLKRYAECKIVAVYDYDTDRGKKWAQELGCVFTDSYEEILQNKNIDAVVIMVPVKFHAEYIIKAAEAGKHIFTEKPLAGNMEDACKIREAVEKSNIHFVLSDPVKKPTLMYAKNMVREGKIGRVTSMRVRITTEELVGDRYSDWRMNHTGEEMCGGDLIDIGHHSVHILHWFLGKADSVVSICSQVTDFAKKDGTEDNAVAVYGYKDGAIGIAEAGSVSKGNKYEFEIFGTKGCIQGTKMALRYCIEGKEWVRAAESEFPEAYEYILYYWIRNIIDNRQDEMFGVEESFEVLEMILAAYRSTEKIQKIQYK